jgi:hypothetical protein
MNNLDRRFINWVFECSFLVVVFALAGSFLDGKLNTGANLMSLGLLAGFGIGGWNFYKIYKDIMTENDKQKKETLNQGKKR